MALPLFCQGILDNLAAELCPPFIKVALLMSCSRQSSVTGIPFSTCFNSARIWLSKNQEVFM